MFLSHYSRNKLDFDSAQFILAIVLDGLGQDTAAHAVLVFGGREDKSVSSTEQIERLRSKAREAVKNDYIEKNGRKIDKNVMMATIDYFWHEKVLYTKSRNGVYARNRLCSLEELVSGVKREQLYVKAMNIVFETPVNKLIVVYMNTHMFNAEFRKTLNRYLARINANSKSTISSQVATELRNGFAKFIDSYCSNGSYQISSSTPNMFLLRTGSDNGPLVWYSKETSGEFYDILNKRGINSNIAGGDKNYTILDNAELDVSRTEHPINFISVCTKITKASCLLFSHKREDVATYDIFSHYRDTKQRQPIRRFENVEVLGCDVKPTNDIRLDADCSETTAMDKINGRMFICELFEQEFSKDISKEHIYDRIYLEVLRQTDSKTKNNGVRLFATDQHTPKTGLINNSDKLRILVDGYIALFDFLAFLNSSSNRKGVTINEVPVDIFRVTNLLKRFRTFDEYIDYNSDVIKLYTEVSMSPVRSLYCVDGLYSNDAVYESLSQQQLLGSDPDLVKLMQSSMSVFRKSVSKCTSKDQNKETAQALSDFAKGFQGINVKPEELKRLSLPTLEKVMVQQSEYVLTNYLGSLAPNMQLFVDACDFALVLMEVMHREGTPVLDDDYLYNLEKEFMAMEFTLPEEYVEVVGQAQAVRELMRRAKAVRVLYRAMLGIPFLDKGVIVSNKSLEIEVAWEDFRNFWCCCGILIKYFNWSEEVLKHFSSDQQKSIYLMYTRVAYYNEYFRLHHAIRSTTELQALYKNNVLASCDLKVDVQNNALAENKRAAVCRVVNRLMASQKKICKVYGELLNGANTIFSRIPSGSKFSNWVETKLIAARDSINQMVLIDTTNRRLSQVLTSMYNVDELGYIKIGTGRYSYKGKVFVHSAGYAVDIGPIREVATDIRAIPQEIRDDMEMQKRVKELGNG